MKMVLFAMMLFFPSTVISATINQSFSNISSQLYTLDSRVAVMSPTVITQSISFLLGTFCALTFCLTVKYWK